MDNVVRDAIIAIADRNGGFVTADELLEAAIDPRSPLHATFEWDDSQAAHEYRLIQARQLIRLCRIEISVTKIGPSYRAPVFAPSPTERGYETIAHLRQDPDNAREVAVAEFATAARYLRRARQIAIELGFGGDLIDRTIAQLTGMQEKLEPREEERGRGGRRLRR